MKCVPGAIRAISTAAGGATTAISGHAYASQTMNIHKVRLWFTVAVLSSVVLLFIALACCSCSATIPGTAVRANRTFVELRSEYMTAVKTIAAQVGDTTGLSWGVVIDSWRACQTGRIAVIGVEFSDQITDAEWPSALAITQRVASDYGAKQQMPLEDGMANHVVSITGGDAAFLLGTQVRGMIGVNSPCGVLT